MLEIANLSFKYICVTLLILGQVPSYLDLLKAFHLCPTPDVAWIASTACLKLFIDFHLHWGRLQSLYAGHCVLHNEASA